MRLLEASLGHFGGTEHFGSIWGTFWPQFGDPERTWKRIPYQKGGSFFFAHHFFLKCKKQLTILEPGEAFKIDPEMASKKVIKTCWKKVPFLF